MLLDQYQYALSVMNQINDICTPFFKTTGISYFHFARRMYYDEKTGILFSSPDLLHLLFEKKLYFSLEELRTRYSCLSPYYLSAHLSFEKGVLMGNSIYDECKILESVTISDFYNNFFELYTFGWNKKPNCHTLLFSLENIIDMNKFITYFKYQAKDLILTTTLASNRNFDPHYLESTKKDPKYNNHLSLEITPSNFSFNEKESHFCFETSRGSIFLTHRQSECLSLYSQGYTAKEIARILNITHTTVQKHIENVKISLNCHYREELRNIFNSNKALAYVFSDIVNTLNFKLKVTTHSGLF